ncbi:hypothetical protein BKP64_12220 [Marinobacter salinus]|uniref:LamG-like jellyroll fold domain-containing protein n=1 Tax=Marinobacter salinus TaxID=1874317 RepID=A0A1D9GMK1_9GAMM|nr:DUF6701 domain-containing protein [Marinobacter salinus]AOY88872.1 hypothetical protein BKP64_12220 [Marinobacter salinus]
MRQFKRALQGFLKWSKSLACSLIVMILPQFVYAECSDFAGLATINEISEKDGFIEIKLLSSSVLVSDYETWQLEFCALAGNKNNPSTACSSSRSVSLANQSTSPWLIMDGNDLGSPDINLLGMDVRLSDAQGKTIDYVRVGSSVSNSEDASCSSSPDELPFDTRLTLVGGESGKYARRRPDGTGEWTMSSGASDGKDTEGSSNDEGVSGPLINVDNVTVFQGDTAVFTVELGAAAATDIRIDYATLDGSATQGVDYEARVGTLTIPSGQSQGTVSISTLQSGSLDQRKFLLRLRDARDASGARYGIFESEIGVGTILPAAVGDWHLDNGPWNGSVGEVLDSSGNGLNGRAVTSPEFSVSLPARSGSPGTCGYGDFDGTSNQFIEISDQSALDLPGPLTVSAWVNVRRFPRSGLHTIASKDENFEFHINSSNEIYWWWRTQNGGTHSFTTSGANLVEDQWYHIAVVYESGLQRIYVDGIEKGRANRSGSLMTNGDPLHIGQDQFFSGRYFDGRIDEVTVFSAAFGPEGIAALYRRVRPCAFNRLDGFEVNVPAVASVCGAAEVTIRAFDQNGNTLSGYAGLVSLQTSSGSGNWSPGFLNIPSGSLTPTPDNNNDGAASYQFDAGDNGSVSLLLENATADELTILASDLADGQQGRSGPVQFLENAFVIESTDAEGLDIVAERDHSFLVTAIRRDSATGECGPIADYDRQVAVKAWLSRSGDDPGGVAPELDSGVSVLSPGSAVPLSDNLTLDFSGGFADFSLFAGDVGQYRLNLLDETSGIVVDATGSPLPVAGTSALWTVRPDRFTLAVTDNPAATDANGPLFKAAGQPFELVVSAVGASGNPLLSFGQEGSPQGASISHSLIKPVGGQTGILSGPVSLPGALFNGGRATVSNLSWNEVGILELSAKNSTYLGVAPEVSGASGEVGRFVPDRFDVSVSVGELAPFCDAGAAFVYSGQPMEWAVVPTLTISAMGPGTYVTRNYTEGDFLKLTALDVSRSAPSTDNAQMDLSGAGYPITASLQTGLFSVASPGTGVYAFSTTDEFVYQKSVDARISPFSPDMTVTVHGIEDSDGVLAPTAPISVTPLAPLDVRYGRWVIENVYGPENVSELYMRFGAEFWEGGRYVSHNADDCSQWATTPIADPEVHHSLVSGSGTLGGGLGGPLTLQPNGTQGTDTLVWDVPVWFEDDEDGDGSLDDPTGLATFGVYRGHDRVIYWQER